MRRKLLWINLALLVAVIGVGNVVQDQWRIYLRQHTVPKAPAGASGSAASKTAPQPAPPQAPLPQAGNYNLIFERSLFSPNRTEFEPAEPAAAAPAIPPMPGMPILSGI